MYCRHTDEPDGGRCRGRVIRRGHRVSGNDTDRLRPRSGNRRGRRRNLGRHRQRRRGSVAFAARSGCCGSLECIARGSTHLADAESRVRCRHGLREHLYKPDQCGENTTTAVPPEGAAEQCARKPAKTGRAAKRCHPPTGWPVGLTSTKQRGSYRAPIHGRVPKTAELRRRE